MTILNYKYKKTLKSLLLNEGKFYVKILLSLSLCLILSCSNTTEPNNNNLSFTVEDASCIEAWLSFKRNGIKGEVNVSLYKENNLTAQFNLPDNDTVFVDEGLLPNTIYNYEAVFTQGNITISKLKASVQTMDTTSSNFTWETFTFGQHSSSVLYDVAIIDENNIWCVGEIYMNDSLGNPDPHAYNAVHWDGEKWEVKRILYNGNFWVIRTVFAINSNDIWFSAFVRYDGNRFIQLPIPDILMGGSVNKLWGTSSSNLYIVGNDGNIAHYNGSSWRRIESGTDLDLYDIVGYMKDNDYEVMAIASKIFVNAEKKVIRIKNNSINNVSVIGIPYSIKEIWYKPGIKYYVVGSGMFSKTNINTNQPWKAIWGGITEYYTNSLDGNGLNEIAVSGDYGELLYFNGAKWRSYRNELGMYSASYQSIKIKESMVVVAGYNSPKAIITIGRR